MATGGWDYPSLSMVRGIEPDKLIKASAVLMGCMQLDPRGGYIRQTDLFTVIWQIVILQQYAFTFQAYCSAKKHPSVQAGVGRVAYSLRVMLSHTKKLHAMEVHRTRMERLRSRTAVTSRKVGRNI